MFFFIVIQIFSFGPATNACQKVLVTKLGGDVGLLLLILGLFFLSAILGLLDGVIHTFKYQDLLEIIFYI